MPDTTPATSPAAEEAAWRLEDIAGHLTAAGLRARLHHTRHSTYLTATAGSGREEVETTFDDDSYCEVRFWVAADASPAHVSATIIRAMTAITST
jgi:hypothetical protein